MKNEDREQPLFTPINIFQESADRWSRWLEKGTQVLNQLDVLNALLRYGLFYLFVFGLILTLAHLQMAWQVFHTIVSTIAAHPWVTGGAVLIPAFTLWSVAAHFAIVRGKASWQRVWVKLGWNWMTLGSALFFMGVALSDHVEFTWKGLVLMVLWLLSFPTRWIIRKMGEPKISNDVVMQSVMKLER